MALQFRIGALSGRGVLEELLPLRFAYSAKHRGSHTDTRPFLHRASRSDDGFWARTRHAIVRNFVTYDRTEKSLRPQVMPYLGAFGGAALATTWQPGNPFWQVRGYQAAITQVFVGMGINWLGEFAPEIVRVLRKKKKGVQAFVP